jgi:tetratricopeptide (TPR) repeat protein
MKNLTLIVLFLASSFLSFAQVNISTGKWQEDLRFLQKTIHSDYSFLFKKVTPKTFDAEVEKFYKEIPNLEEHEIIVGMARMVALFEYGHTSIGLNSWRKHGVFNFHQMPYNMMVFKDGVYMQGVQKDYYNGLGAKVLEIEGHPIEEVLKAVKPVFPTENDQFFKAYGMHYLGIPEVLHAQGIMNELKPEVMLTLKKGGFTFRQTYKAIEVEKFPGSYGHIQQSEDWLDAREEGTTPLYLKNLDKIYYYEYLPEHKTVYVRQSQVQDDPSEAIPEFYDRVFKFIEENDVEKLVLDVRLNGGGNNYKNKPVIKGIIRSDKINKAGNFFVITGGRTFSACQNLVNELSNYTEAIFIGEPTGENINFYGDNREVVLPNSKIPVRLSFAWWQDKPQWKGGPWTAPHLAVEMSFEDYRTNHDPVLQTALEFSADNFIIDPMQHLTDLYQSGNMEQLQKDATIIINDPMYRFFDFEGEFNTVGYNLLNNGQHDTAIAVFGFITQFFPESANAWDSLAEGHWKAGQVDKAKALYEKAISMDPEGVVGDNARKMLKKIKEKE